jgi:hypothetical protein
MARPAAVRNPLGKYILDSRGQPVPCPGLMKWARWIETSRVKWQKVDQIGPLRVSTIFLGLDHNFPMKGRPILWETMVFNDDMRGFHTFKGKRFYFSHDQGQWRHRSRTEAYRFHRKMVEDLEAKYQDALKVIKDTWTQKTT